MGCPALLHLALLWNESYLVEEPGRQRNQPSRQNFLRLRTAEVACRENTEEEPNCQLCPAYLVTVLLSPLLQQLKLSHCNNLTDELLSNVLTESSLMNLQKLELNKCNDISMDGLTLL